jgi:hypothetical protein
MAYGILYVPHACARVAEMIPNASLALAHADGSAAKKVFAAYPELVREVVYATGKAIALKNSSAGSAAIMSAEQLLQMGTIARQIAVLAIQTQPSSAVPESLADHFVELGRTAGVLVQSLGTLCEPDGSPNQVISRESKFHKLRGNVLTIATSAHWGYGVAAALQTMRLVGFYDRFADHCAATAECLRLARKENGFKN